MADTPPADAQPVEPLTAALAILDVIDGIVDDTHPEGDGCPLCVALDDLRAALDAARAGDGLLREALADWLDRPQSHKNFIHITEDRLATVAREWLAASDAPLRATEHYGSTTRSPRRLRETR